MYERKRIQVLIADQDRLARETMVHMLHEMGYQTVAEAADGLEAVDKAFTLLPDVVLIDADLSQVNGVEAVELICAMCPTPVVMLSWRNGRELRERLERSGAAAGLVKPPTPHELERAISTATRQFWRAGDDPRRRRRE
jgi:AmiR/NasT family two-component response regulator